MINFKKLKKFKIHGIILGGIFLVATVLAVLLAINFNVLSLSRPVFIASKPSSSSSKTAVSSQNASSQDSLSEIAVSKPIKSPLPQEVRGVWISTQDNSNFPSKTGLSIDAQKAEINKIFDNSSALGMNTVFVQVRSNADALYKSDLYPWSVVLTGVQGNDPGYDPLAYMIDAAHKRGMIIEAWVNPYRVKTANSKTNLAANNPAVKHSDWVVTSSDGSSYLNPGIPAVRNYVVDGIAEIVKNYNVDGIYLDDYYPNVNFNDYLSYLQYGNGMGIDIFRRESINGLITEVSKKIKKIDPTTLFGVGVNGVWANKSSIPEGSDTKAPQESYFDQFADSKKWVQSLCIDYICPQIYYSIGNSTADFSKITDWWVNILKDTRVKLFIGHAAYKAGTNESGWQSPDQIVKQIKYAKQYPQYKGSVFFGYSQLISNVGGVKDSIIKYYNGTLDVITFGKELIVASPANGITTNESQIKISGTSDSNFPLTLNSKPVDRSSKGMFTQMLNLKAGKNTFTLVHKGKTITIIVNYSVDILKSFSPTEDILETGNTPINFSVVAHKDSTVYAQINGTKITMKPIAISQNDNTDTTQQVTDYVTYAGTYTLPASKTTVQNLSKIQYTANWNGFTKSVKGVTFKVKDFIPPTQGKRYVATIKASPISDINTDGYNNQYIETYLYNDDLYRPVTYPQQPGAWDYLATDAKGVPISLVNNNSKYYKLSNGELIYTDNVNVELKDIQENNKISSIAESSYDNNRYTRFALKCSQKITYTAGTNQQFSGKNVLNQRDYSVSSFNASSFQITLFNTDTSVDVDSVLSPLISSVSHKIINNTTVQYIFTLKNAGVFYGSYINYDSSGNLIIDFKNPWNGDLTNLRIAIDAGHGFYDSGALSPTHNTPNEKNVNLKYATSVCKKLIDMGVKNENIFMTRTADTYPELMARTIDMINFRPDFSLCIHCNASNGVAAGVESYYFQPFSQPLVKDIQSRLVQAYKDGKSKGFNYSGMGTDRGAKFTKAIAYYSCRQIEMPSTLIECGFVDNPNELEWLWSDAGSDLMTSAITNGVMDFMNSEKIYS